MVIVQTKLEYVYQPSIKSLYNAIALKKPEQIRPIMLHGHSLQTHENK